MIYEYGEPWWNNIDRGRPKNSEKNLSECHFVHHNPTWTDLGLHGVRLATNHISLNITLRTMPITNFSF
jgi:hypothetical protein